MIGRVGYVAGRFGYAFLSAFSRLFNALFLNGSTSESTSARAFREPWPRAVKIINVVLWLFERDHCRKAWVSEVSDAIKTLERNDLIE